MDCNSYRRSSSNCKLKNNLLKTTLNIIQIEKKEIDTLELQPEVWKLQNEIFPTIRFHTGYNDEMDPPEEHPLLIDGIVPDKPILLKRSRRMH